MQRSQPQPLHSALGWPLWIISEGILCALTSTRTEPMANLFGDCRIEEGRETLFSCYCLFHSLVYSSWVCTTKNYSRVAAEGRKWGSRIHPLWKCHFQVCAKVSNSENQEFWLQIPYAHLSFAKIGNNRILFLVICLTVITSWNLRILANFFRFSSVPS